MEKKGNVRDIECVWAYAWWGWKMSCVCAQTHAKISVSLLGPTLVGLRDNARCKMTGQSSGESLRYAKNASACPG